MRFCELRNINPFVPIVTVVFMQRMPKKFDSKTRRDDGKISYERRDYESVDDKSLS